jgi:festuclavine dehydrogenase
MTILLTGGTGKTGLPLAKLLHSGGHKVLLTSRTPSSIPAPYVGVKFDWFDKSTWEAPFKAANGSVKAIYLVSPPSLEAVETIKSFIEFAQAKGTKRFVLLSASPVERGGFGLGPVHEYLATSKLEYSVLRPTWFTGKLKDTEVVDLGCSPFWTSENFTEQPPYVKVITEQDSFATATSKASLPFISTEDIGRVAVRVLTAEKSLDTDFVIVGPELLTYDQVSTQWDCYRMTANRVAPGCGKIVGGHEAYNYSSQAVGGRGQEI